MSNIIGTFNDLTVVASDGSGTPVTATCSLLVGEGSLGPIGQNGREVTVQESQGSIVGLRLGGRSLPQLKVTAYVATPLDAFRKLVLGETSSTTTTFALGDVFTVHLTLGLNLSSPSETRTIVLQDCHVLLEDLSLGADGNRVSMTATCYGTITATDASGSTITIRSGN